MPYVKRNEAGRIVALSVLDEPGSEYIHTESAELAEFLGDVGSPSSRFTQADRDFIRVIEDIIYLLIDKSILRLTDLPPAVQHKLALRRSLRDQQGDLSGIVPQHEEMPLP